MKELRTQIKINATPEKVWRVLTDFKAYPEWNPFITKLEGTLAPGQKLTVTLAPPNERVMTIQPTLLEANPNKMLRWKGQLLFPGIFDGEHIFEIIDNKDGTSTFVHRENFSGILIPLFKKMLDVSTKRGFEMMNEELKRRSEHS